MTTVTITTYMLNCPECKHTLHKGRRHRDFGPGQVRCRHCSSVFDSTLNEWAGLTFGEKLKAATSEFLLPSSSSKMEPNAFILLMFIFPIIVLISPVLLVISFIRLVRMIRESNRFTRTRIPPVW